MSVLYHRGEFILVGDAISRLYIGSIAHIEDEKNELVCDVYRLSRCSISEYHQGWGYGP